MPNCRCIGKGGFGVQDALTEILRQRRLTTIVDIGANPIDGDPPYKPMLEAGLCEVIGFEPQPDALARLRNSATENETYLPYAVCSAPGMTSLLEPDLNQLAHFNLFPSLGTVLEKRKICTVCLDDIDEISDLDFLKIDVQGSELMVFSNGTKSLNSAVAVQTEVSFVPLYVGQPSFGQVENFLRKLGFVPHCFLSIKKWALSPTAFSGNPRKAGNQLLEADIVYVKDFTKLADMESEKIKHLAMLSHHIFQSYDLVNLALIELKKRGEVERDSLKQYLASVAVSPPS
jgi:FkbM family methyltransferase